MKLFKLIKRELLKGLEYTILIWCIILVICIVFNVNIENKAAFIILVPLLGKAAHYLNNITVSENTDIMKYSVPIIGSRTKVINDKDVKTIYYKEIPTTIFMTKD